MLSIATTSPASCICRTIRRSVITAGARPAGPARVLLVDSLGKVSGIEVVRPLRHRSQIFERAHELARDIGHSLGDVQALAGLVHSYRLCDRPAEATGSNEAEVAGALGLCRLILANLERSVAIGSMISRKDTTTCFRGIRGLW